VEKIEDHVTNSNFFFVSHCWSWSFHSLFERIQTFVERDPSLENSFFWIDIFAINQHEGLKQKHDLEELSNIISLSKKTLLCMDDKGNVLTRAWCLYEVWKTVTEKKFSDLLILMNPEDDILEVYQHFHMDKAKASFESDRIMILNSIEKKTGLQQMTITIKQSLLESSIEDVLSLELLPNQNSKNIFNSLYCCTQLHRFAGKLEIAEENAKKMNKLAREKLDNQYLAKSMENLGTVLSSQGKYYEAEKLFQEALEIRKNLFGEENPEVISLKAWIANVLKDQGKYTEAEKLAREVLVFRKKLVGEDTLLFASSLSNLASILSSQGKYIEAEQLYREVFTIRKKLLGEEHPLVATSMSWIASLLSNQKKYQESEQLHRETLKLRQKLLGEEHPDVASSMSNLASVLSLQKKYVESEQIHRNVFVIRKKIFGEEHPLVATSMSWIASLLSNQEKYEESEQLHRETLKLRRKILGEEHPDVASSMINLASVLSNQGKYEESEQLLRETLILRKKIYKENHPLINSTLTNLVSVLEKQGKTLEIEKLKKEEPGLK